MKHMIKWLKVCAFLLAVILVVHTLEIMYDIYYHNERELLFKSH
jgi:hypothetical protein